MKEVLHRLGGFSVATLAPAAVSLLAVPVLIRATGREEWTAIAVGQSAGTVAGILLGLGWGFNGPTMVARADRHERVQIAVDSIVARVLVAPVIVAVACIVAALLQPGHALVASMSCAGVVLLGLNMTWLFIGAGDVRSLLAADALPRVAATVVGAAASWTTGSAVPFVVCQLVGAVVSIGVSATVAIRRPTDGSGPEWGVRRAASRVRQQLPASVTVITASVYLSVPTLVVAALAPEAAFLYALADRITRMTFLAIGPLYQWMQGWVPSTSDRAEMLRRIATAGRLSLGTAVTLGAAIALFAPLAARVLGGTDVVLPWTLAVPLAVSVAMSAVSRWSGMVSLLALGADRVVAFSAILGALCGIPLLLVLVPIGGAVGAAVAVMISETIVTGNQGVQLRRRLRAGVADARTR